MKLKAEMANKILFDIGHPAHVHYFKNIIRQMRLNGKKIYVIARDKDITLSLLDQYKIDYVSRGKGGLNILGRILYWFKVLLITYNYVKIVKPDIIVSFAGTYAAHASRLCGIPHICFTDTEAARIGILALLPFTKILITPKCFKKSYGKKHARFNSLFELAYLSPKTFTPNENIYKILNIPRNDPYVIIRFVSWTATHDLGEQGISSPLKLDLIHELSKYAKVFISSEGELSKDFLPFKINIPPEKMHDALAFSSLYFGESPTMTTESALLGTPAICISSWAIDCGNFNLLNSYNLIHCYKPGDQSIAIKKALEIVKNKNSKKIWLNRKNKFLNDMGDVNNFMYHTLNKM